MTMRDIDEQVKRLQDVQQKLRTRRNNDEAGQTD
jgi:hypothetical protein